MGVLKKMTTKNEYVSELSADEQIREYVRQREKALQDYYSDIAVAETKGVEKGKSEEKNDIALSMIADGQLPFETIAKYTGLTLERVKELAAQNSV